MNSRDKILSQLKKHLVGGTALPEPVVPAASPMPHAEKLKTVLESIGGQVIHAENWKDAVDKLRLRFASPSRWMNVVPELNDLLDSVMDKDPHLLEDVTLGVLRGHFAVAENGAVWITADRMGDRALPFICEHLALIINIGDIHPTMYEAYEAIGKSTYDFGTFIAGPSKTADIEQALVLGAHGPKSMTLVMLQN